MRGFVGRLERGHERGVEDAERERQARAGQRTPRDGPPIPVASIVEVISRTLSAVNPPATTSVTQIQVESAEMFQT